jgi:hypothetical protein
MQTEFKAIVQSEYGAPEKVLRIAKRQLRNGELGADDALVKVIARPLHHGDIQILSALPQGGPVEPIPQGTLRVPGLESVSIMSWFRLTHDEKQKDFGLALSLATNHPELFEVAHEYEFGDFQKAIQHVSSPGKTGIVLLKSRV